MIFPYNNRNIYYETRGEGPAILLLHGFLEDSRMWEPLMSYLQEKFRVVTMDLPGHGRSDVFNDTHSMEFMAEIAHGLIAHLQLGSVSLLGHSMGGYVSLAYLELYPSEVRQLILLNSTPFDDSPDKLNNRKRALELIPKNKKLFVTMSILNLFAEDRREDLTAEIRTLQQQALQIPTKGILAAIRGMMKRKDRSEVLTKFQGSKFMIAGTKDEVVLIQDSKKAAKLTDSVLVKVESGHMTLIENLNELMKFVHFIE